MKKKALTAGIMAAFLTGCSEPVEVATYGSITACERSTGNREMCEDAWVAQMSANAQHAPKFESQLACEESFGDQCRTERVQNSDGSWSNVIVPMMAGMMISNMMNGSNVHQQYQPVYREKDRKGNFVGSGYVTNQGNSIAPGKSKISPTKATTIKPSSRPIARGGFGSAGRGGSAAS